MSTVSVVVPTFNGAPFIREALESVFAQTRLPAEIIVADDCSTDATAAIVSDLAGQAPVPVRLIATHKNSGGPAHPLNLAIEACQGELIAPLDQDDVFLPNKIADQARILEKYPDVHFVFSCAELDYATRQPLQPDYILQTLERLGQQADEACRIIPGPDVLRLLLKHYCFIGGYPSIMFRRRDWLERGRLDTRYKVASDYDLECGLCTQGSVAYTTQTPGLRRMHDGSLTRRRLVTLFESYDIIAKYITLAPWLLNDEETSAILRQHMTGAAYWARMSGHYRKAIHYHTFAARVWGWKPQSFWDMGKLLPTACYHLLKKARGKSLPSPFPVSSEFGLHPVPASEPRP
jgi:glycosyltransferase involved in cell wall biosynthesis